jgi:hypothetical protein
MEQLFLNKHTIHEKVYDEENTVTKEYDKLYYLKYPDSVNMEELKEWSNENMYYYTKDCCVDMNNYDCIEDYTCQDYEYLENEENDEVVGDNIYYDEDGEYEVDENGEYVDHLYQYMLDRKKFF